MTMPAGKYYIGDLCYVMNDVWSEFCDLTISGNKVLDGEFELAGGRRIATYSTAYGDGEYCANTGGVLGVDAGLIGCIRVEDIRDRKADPAKSGIVVEFATPFETWTDGAGVIHFGHVWIDTNGTDEDVDGDEHDAYA